MLKQIGEAVEKGEPIARSKGIFGAFKTEVVSDAAGTLEQVSSVTGQVMIRGAAIPVQVRAYLSGKVVEVLPKEGCIIENDVMFVQGIFGIGGETEGVIHVACSSHEETLEADAITPRGRHQHVRLCLVVHVSRLGSGPEIVSAPAHNA